MWIACATCPSIWSAAASALPDLQLLAASVVHSSTHFTALHSCVLTVVNSCEAQNLSPSPWPPWITELLYLQCFPAVSATAGSSVQPCR